MAKPHKNLDSIWLTAFNKRLISRNTADVTDLCSFLSFWGISSYRILFCTPHPPLKSVCLYQNLPLLAGNCFANSLGHVISCIACPQFTSRTWPFSKLSLSCTYLLNHSNFWYNIHECFVTACFSCLPY